MRNKKKILKYTYLLTVFVFFIVIMLLNQFNIVTREKLNKFETSVIALFREASPLYVIIALLGVVILNGLGFRDIFGFTNFFIIVISKFLHNDTRIQIIISIIISGVFMALE